MYSHRYYNVQPQVLQCTARCFTMYSRRYIIAVYSQRNCITNYSQRYYNLQPEELHCTARGITMHNQRYYDVQPKVLQFTAMQGNTVHIHILAKRGCNNSHVVHVVEFIALGCTMITTRAETVHWDSKNLQTVGKIVPIFSRLYIQSILPFSSCAFPCCVQFILFFPGGACSHVISRGRILGRN
jgi:hypothetical protein